MYGAETNSYNLCNPCTLIGTFSIDLVKLDDISPKSIYEYILSHRKEFFSLDGINIRLTENFCATTAYAIAVNGNNQAYWRYIIGNIRIM